ncbi:MAG: hypothetical protein C4521_01000 [Actinobacteria bacterium]|nr:MAG: hypothetical protein C4521_01000 [Actinomycetota bacterium]
MLGLSGAGKDYASGVLTEVRSFRHVNMDHDGKRAFERAGLPKDWDKDILLVDFHVLAAGIRHTLANKDRGVVLSFPTTCRFTREQLIVASRLGVAAIVLWGPLTLLGGSLRPSTGK